MNNIQFYRYEAVSYASLSYDGDYVVPLIPNIKLQLQTYNLIKETPKGYWIGYGFPIEGKLSSKGRWVSKTARKRYAFPTKEEALNNFIKRTEKRLKILSTQADHCKYSIGLAKMHKI